MAAKRRQPLSRGVKIAWILLAGVIFGGGLYLGVELGKPPPPPDLARLASTPAEARGGETGGEEPSTEKDVPEDFPEDAVGDDAGEDGDAGDDVTEATPRDLPFPLVRQPAPGTAGGTRVALVIDDMGRSLEHVERLSDLGISVTFAVLPYEIRTAEVVDALAALDAEYIVHLPMEAQGGADPGPGALGAEMAGDELIAATREALARVPGAVGVNNHMGSAVVTDLPAMEAVLGELRRRDLYFLDSRTASETLGYTLARRLGVPAAERQVFLDTQRDRAAIRRQFDRLLALAEERGGAIAIAHPYDETLDVLAQGIPEARARGIEFVPVSSLLDR